MLGQAGHYFDFLGRAEVAQFRVPGGVYENVVGLEVPVSQFLTRSYLPLQVGQRPYQVPNGLHQSGLRDILPIRSAVLYLFKQVMVQSFHHDYGSPGATALVFFVEDVVALADVGVSLGDGVLSFDHVELGVAFGVAADTLDYNFFATVGVIGRVDFYAVFRVAVAKFDVLEAFVAFEHNGLRQTTG